MAAARQAFAALVAASLLAACQPAASQDPTFGAPLPGSPTSSPPAGSPGPDPTGGPAASPIDSVPTTATWARLEVDGTGPAAREDHTWTVAEDGRTAYLFGGRDGGAAFDDLWSFDLVSERWHRERIDGKAPPARFGHDAAWLPGHGLVIWAGQVGADFFDDTWLLDPAGPSWTELKIEGDKPVARYGSCSGVGPDGRLWISHGFTANGVRFDDTWTFDIEERRWTERTPASKDSGPIKRCLHACWWTSEGQLALYGGQTNGVPALGDLWFLTPGVDGEQGIWAEAPGQEAPARQLAAVARRGDLAVIFGGRGADGEVLADAWVVADGTTALAPLAVDDAPRARSGAAMVYDAAGDRLVLFGGEGDDAFDDVWELTFP